MMSLERNGSRTVSVRDPLFLDLATDSAVTTPELYRNLLGQRTSARVDLW